MYLTGGSTHKGWETLVYATLGNALSVFILFSHFNFRLNTPEIRMLMVVFLQRNDKNTQQLFVWGQRRNLNKKNTIQIVTTDHLVSGVFFRFQY